MNWYKKAKFDKAMPEYVYHGTGEGAFRNIRKHGLIPNKFLYLSDTEQYAASYAQRKGNPYGNRILRVRRTEDMIPDASTGFQGDFKLDRVILPEDIEVRVNGEWVPIKAYVNEDIGIL